VKITKVNEPWPYLIIDDTFPQDIFDNFVAEVEKRLAHMNPEQSVVYYEITGNDESNIPSVKRLIDSVYIRDFIDYFDNRRSSKPVTELQRASQVAMSRNYICPVHDESFKKVLSFITYLGPDKSTGTTIYRTETEFVTQIEWKPNRTLVFCGINDVTWHGYEAGSEKRVTLNQFLYDRDAKPYRPPNPNNNTSVEALREQGYDV
jgi:hypothetical protein